ncbi:MAG TPA: polyprenyl synthetase family protein [Candidatus Acidoferrales bacterium]|jgi:geranylgeranyl diphosphate synthase type I|nr:polyprenyl synthetase family protein [Candidatus Acidoferrales bacterium]
MLLCHFGYGKHGPARRGKRLRPQMVMRVALGEGAPLERALDAAVAVEIFHNYSLVHDDIEDGDRLRHGRPTLWSAYGVPHAINAGDAMCALSFASLTSASSVLDGERVLAMLMVLHEAHAIMCEGQSLDLRFESERHVDLTAYHRMIACKTAELFSASCRLGAHAAGCSDAAIAAYGDLGRAYGMAFQIQDDVHGVWSSADATGKVSGVDIARRKWTFPIAWAIAQPPSPSRDAVASAYAQGRPLERQEVDQVIEALERLGAREAAQSALAEQLAVVERHPNRELRGFLLGTFDLAAAAR